MLNKMFSDEFLISPAARSTGKAVVAFSVKSTPDTALPNIAVEAARVADRTEQTAHKNLKIWVIPSNILPELPSRSVRACLESAHAQSPSANVEPTAAMAISEIAAKIKPTDARGNGSKSPR